MSRLPIIALLAAMLFLSVEATKTLSRNSYTADYQSFNHESNDREEDNDQNFGDLADIIPQDPKKALQNALKAISATEFGEHVVKLVDLELRAGKGITDKVLAFLREIQTNLQVQLDQETTAYSKEKTLINNEVQDLTTKAQQANSDLADSEAQIKDMSKSNEHLNKEIPRIKGEIDRITAQKKIIENNKIQDGKDFMERLGDLREMLTILSQLIDDLTQIALSGKSPSLAQQRAIVQGIRAAKINDPVISLAAVSTSMDPGVIKNVVARLDNIKKVVEAAVAQNEEDIKETQLNFQSLHDALELVLDRLYTDLSKESLDLSKSENDLAILLNRRDYAKRVIAAANAEKSNKLNQLQVAEDKFAARSNKLSKEIQTISDAIGIMVANAASLKASEGIGATLGQGKERVDFQMP